MRALARWCFTHRRLTLAAWVAVLVALTALHSAVGSNYRDSFRLHGTDSFDALNLLQDSAPKAAGDTDRIVVATKQGKLTDPATKQQIENMLAEIEKLPHVASIGKPAIAKNGQIGYVTFNFDTQANKLELTDIKRVIKTAQAAKTDNLQVELGGQAIQAANPQGTGGTAPGFLAAAVVLFLVFGSLLSMLLPLLTAGVSLGAGVAAIGLLSHAISTPEFSSELSLLIGLGVGVDYALFIVTRHRQGLLRGNSIEESAIDAVDTAGRAVLFAGMTVCIALLGMFALGVSFLYGVAIAASLVVAFTVIAALTLLPAMLGFFGLKVLRRKERRALKEGAFTETDESPAWGRWARTLEKRPALLAAGAALFMLVLAIPFLHLRLGSSDQGSDPKSTTTRQAYDLLAKGFGPGFNGPLQLVAQTPTAQDKAAFARVTKAAASTPGVVASTPPSVTNNISISEVVPKGSPQDESTTKLLRELRHRVIPRASAGTDIRVLVGGQTAIFEDFSHVLASKLPLFIGVVVLLSFLLLMVVFRSIVIPTMAALMNLLSVAAGFGVVVAVFQWGWGASLIGVDKTGPIEAFVPVLTFAILFGLSMDYEVFLVSRIYEEWHKRRNNEEAVVHGLAATGRTITAAAAIMVLVFGAFVLGGFRVIKLFGVALAAAILLDAVIVRSILIPGLMLVVGEANWAFPKALDKRLPHFNVEPAEVQLEQG
ncbi:MAG TPA: MMPL family transporter [Methylomirabilota bacterium]